MRRQQPLRTAETDIVSADHVMQRLQLAHDRVTALAQRRRLHDPDPDDPYRGSYVSAQHVDQILGGGRATVGTDLEKALRGALDLVEADADDAEADGILLRLRSLSCTFALDEIDEELLLLACLPDLDAPTAKLYAYLNDDNALRTATTWLLMELMGMSPFDPDDRRRLSPAGPLLRGGLLTVQSTHPLRQVRAAGQVLDHLLGGSALDQMPDAVLSAMRLEDVGTNETNTAGSATHLQARISATLRQAHPLVHLIDRAGAGAVVAARSALHALTGVDPLVVDLAALDTDVSQAVRALVLAGRLEGRGIVARNPDVLARSAAPDLQHLIDADLCRVIIGRGRWDPAWGATVPLTIDAPQSTPQVRTAIWMAAITAHTAPGDGIGVDPATSTMAFRLDPEQIDRAVQAAALMARAEDRPVTDDDLRAGARAQNAAGLERLALRIEPRARWEDLIVSPVCMSGLRDVVLRARRRDEVLAAWSSGGGASRGLGVTGLLAGPSGTGKTMAAEVIAGALGMDLYVIDLSSVVDKYIGETEKNLDRVFEQADRVNGVLLFDEADALFGKRSEVSDAQDRHANIEVAYLLQRMEQFEGIALLTTNLRANIDDAFTRRFDAIVDFTAPDESERRAIWEHHLKRPGLDVADEVDCHLLAERFPLSGGEIHNIVVSAAYMATERDGPIGMTDLLSATMREYRKLGRLTLDSEFDDWHVTPEAPHVNHAP